MKITNKTKISAIMEKYPEAAELMMKNGLYCAGCFGAAFETIEQGAAAHGMNKRSTAKLVKKLNKAVKNGRNKNPGRRA